MKRNMHIDEKFSKKKYEFKMDFEKFGFKDLCGYNRKNYVVTIAQPIFPKQSIQTYLEFDSRRRLC